MKQTSHLTATHIIYYHLCQRKLWLYHNEIKMEHNSQAVGEGKLIEQTAYKRRAARWQALDLGFLKIDHFDPKQKLVKEVKKSPKLEYAHVAQVQYYLWVLQQAGIEQVHGLIEYPRQRKTTQVTLTEEVQKNISLWEEEIHKIIQSENCPPLVRKSYCKSCAYEDFCFS